MCPLYFIMPSPQPLLPFNPSFSSSPLPSANDISPTGHVTKSSAHTITPRIPCASPFPGVVPRASPASARRLSSFNCGLVCYNNLSWHDLYFLALRRLVDGSGGGEEGSLSCYGTTNKSCLCESNLKRRRVDSTCQVMLVKT